jgi:hypothetical protein
LKYEYYIVCFCARSEGLPSKMYYVMRVILKYASHIAWHYHHTDCTLKKTYNPPSRIRLCEYPYTNIYSIIYYTSQLVRGKRFYLPPTRLDNRVMFVISRLIILCILSDIWTDKKKKYDFFFKAYDFTYDPNLTLKTLIFICTILRYYFIYWSE